MTNLLETDQRCEVRANGLDQVNDVLKRLCDRQRPRLSLKDYLEGEMDMHVHYIFRVSDFEVRKFCAILKFLKVKVDCPIKDNLSIFDGIRIDTGAVSNRHGRKQELVLVNDVKIVKEHEGVSVPTASVVERLQSLDHCCGVTAYPILDLRLSSLKRPGILEDWEAHRRSVPFDATRVLPLNQSPKQVIKGGSGVVKAVTDNQGPPDNVGLGMDSKPEEEFTGLCIGVLGDGIRVSFSNKGGSSGLKDIKVFLCPSDLGAEADWKISDPSVPSIAEARSS